MQKRTYGVPVINTENLNEKIGEGIILIEKRRIQMQGM